MSFCLQITQPSPTLPPQAPNDLDRIPDEILSEIFRHVHQPFHFHNYSATLLGPDVVPAATRPWNPVGLQSVCHRWQNLASPVFHCQVAIDISDLASMRALTEAHSKAKSRFLSHPSRNAKLVLLYSRVPTIELRSNRPEWEPLFLCNVGTECISIASPYIFSDLMTQPKRTLVLHTNSLGAKFAIELSSINALVEEFTRRLENKKLLSWSTPTDFSLRLPAANLRGSFMQVLHSLERLACIATVQVHLPFSLSTSLLVSIFPTLTSILQHPSLPAGRDALLEHLGVTKMIVFGTHSDADATALRTRIEELGQLEVPVEVFVLDI
jgi:hypothetical protein